MKIEVQDQKPCQKFLKIALPSNAVKEAHQKIALQFQERSRIPGFRQGKAPMKMVESHFAGEIKSEVLKELLPKACREAVQSEKIQAVADPVVDKIEYDLEKGIHFEAIVDVSPLVELPKYKGLKLERQAVTVAEDEIEKMMNELRAHHAVFQPVSGRALNHEDYALVDYTSLDSKGKKDERKNVLISIHEREKNSLSDRLVGMQVGQTRQVTLEAGKDHPRLDLTVCLNEIKEKKIPELDEDFFKEFQMETLEALREKVRQDIRAYKEKTAREALRNKVMRDLSEAAQFDVPISQVHPEMQNLYSEMVDQAKRGLIDAKSLEKPELQKDVEVEAMRRVRAAYLLHKISQDENLIITQEELSQEIARVAKGMGKSPEELRAGLEREHRLEWIRSRLMQDKVIDFILQHAIIKET
ncbi:MAG: trigger factor [Chlamydiae bacterium]|nr:trigger factor [Chlamydiota bacterium]MBI3265777.1 trigger factor [Chlamydiota bacterium]